MVAAHLILRPSDLCSEWATRQGDVVLSYNHDGSDLIAELIKLLLKTKGNFLPKLSRK